MLSKPLPSLLSMSGQHQAFGYAYPPPRRSAWPAAPCHHCTACTCCRRPGSSRGAPHAGLMKESSLWKDTLQPGRPSLLSYLLFSGPALSSAGSSSEVHGEGSQCCPDSAPSTQQSPSSLRPPRPSILCSPPRWQMGPSKQKQRKPPHKHSDITKLCAYNRT